MRIGGGGRGIWSIGKYGPSGIKLNINNQLVLKTNNTDLKLFMDQGKF